MVYDPSSACSYKSGDLLLKTPLSAHIGLGCNGSQSCRLPKFMRGPLGSSISYAQIHYSCEEGTSRTVSRCLKSPPKSEQDIPYGKRYLILDCDSGMIQVLNSFFGARPSGAVGVTSCRLESNDVVFPTEISCDGRNRCFVPLQEQADEYEDRDMLYLQVHYQCLNLPAVKLKDKFSSPIEPFSIRDYMMSDTDQIASNVLSNDARAVSAQASRSARSQEKRINHTSTIVGGLLLGICVIGAFVIAFILDRKRKERESQAKAVDLERLAITDELVANPQTAPVNDAIEDGFGSSYAGQDTKPLPDEEKTTGNEKQSDGEVSESFMDLINLAEARLQSSQSPTLPRKLDHLPERCRKNPPANVRHLIEKGEKREFYV